ncbi:MAG: cation diffusion facilitator family transporter [Verrucomicrobiae bacterium]|nr:cation diffusion facilitator family transporter [Verrucomicrobiae bacterium]
MKTDQQRQKTVVATLSVVSNSVLIVLKLAAGLAIGSVSLISEAIHSGVDLAAAVIALFAVRKSHRPADKGHPYGHGKVENISGTVEAVLIFVAAIWIIVEAVDRLIHHKPLDTPGWGVIVMLISVVVNTVVSYFLFKVGRETDSAALLADAWHLRTDVYTSAGVMAGLGVVWLGTHLFPQADLRWIDPVAAIVVALLIIKAAWTLTITAGRDLLDTKLPDAEEQAIRSIIARFEPEAQTVHSLRTRKAGARRFVEFHVHMDKKMTVEQAHGLSHQIAAAIEREYPQTLVNIHVEPHGGAPTVIVPELEKDAKPSGD